LSLTLIDLASLLNDTFGRTKEALPLLQEALRLSRDTGNRSLEARALNNIGTNYMADGQLSEAQTYFERALEIREKAQAPQEAADTLHNLGDAFTLMGRYDHALQRYNRALELRRSAGDRHGAALASYGIGMVFDYQGRYGSAVSSKGDALKAFRELQQRDASLVEILGGYGGSLSLAGRTAEAKAPLEEALKLANELKNANLVAQTLSFEADRLFHAGDVKAAQDVAQRATQTSGVTEQGLLLQAQANLAIIASEVQPSASLAARLAILAQEADTRGMKSLSVDCLVRRAETLYALGDRAGALREADRALARSEALGLKVPQAKTHYLRASMLKAKGDRAARSEYSAALRLLEDIKRDNGNDKVLARPDLAAMHTASAEGSKAQ
jgi:tetratricopeptide (TPR) repeat protein